MLPRCSMVCYLVIFLCCDVCVCLLCVCVCVCARACFLRREAVCTLIYVANRTSIPELMKVREQLTYKYGSEFAQKAMRNMDGCVNERVLSKLSVSPPNAFLINNYMKEIASMFKVDWEPVNPDGVMPGNQPVKILPEQNSPP